MHILITGGAGFIGSHLVDLHLARGDQVHVVDDLSTGVRANLAAHGVVEQAASLIAQAEQYWFGLAPEGTRRQVERWKPGFWKIAKAAGVPVVPAYFHYPDKIIGIGPAFQLTDDMIGDIARIRAWYRPWQGRHHGTV